MAMMHENVRQGIHRFHFTPRHLGNWNFKTAQPSPYFFKNHPLYDMKAKHNWYCLLHKYNYKPLKKPQKNICSHSDLVAYLRTRPYNYKTKISHRKTTTSHPNKYQGYTQVSCIVIPLYRLHKKSHIIYYSIQTM